MGKIKALSQSVISGIAAGEVAERPATIIKELIENSLDADATSIRIDLLSGGLDQITVTDNGSGVDPSDLEIATDRHTTSKISNLDDLERITSFGFRGEALASIASVSELTIQSRTTDSLHGYSVTNSFGQKGKVEPVALSPGTRIIAKHLFSQMPARLKFLKKTTTEIRHCIEVVTTASLINSEVEFILTNDQKTLLHTPGQNLADRISDVLELTPPSLLAIHHHNEFITINGFVGSPQTSRRSKSSQYLFINQRPVSHLGISLSVKQAFGTLLEVRAEPLFILHIALPPQSVDSNVHPRKETVRFVDESQILEFVLQTVKAALEKQTFTYSLPETNTWMLRDRSTDISLHQYLKNQVETWQPTDIIDAETIIQINKTYLVMPLKNGYVIVDQHAAHERILFEQFSAAYQSETRKNISEPLLQAAVISLSPRDSLLLLEHLETLHKIGFEIDEFGDNTFKISSLPTLLKDRDPKQLITELLDELNQGTPLSIDSLSHRTLAYLACRSAIKAGDVLTTDQRTQLLQKLVGTPMNATCPHGRPTTILVSNNDLEILFKRK